MIDINVVLNLGGLVLPFLKRRNEPGIAGTIIKNRTPDQKPKEDQEDTSEAHKSAASDLLRAIESKDISGIAEALHNAFQIMDSEPHEEGEHTNEPSPHSYDAQNIKAGENK